MTTPDQRRRHIVRVFERQFSATPTLWVRAPGRVDLMGSHTDYNRGLVLTLAVSLDTWMGLRPRTDGIVALFSLNLESGSSFGLKAIVRLPGRAWCNYVRGVAATFEGEGFMLRGFEAVIHSTVPMGSGLSSSAALECATATAFQALGGWTLDPVQKALLCQRAENEFVGVNCGILDQYTSCAGQEGCALLLDCRDYCSRPVQLADGIQLVVCDTKARRELAGSEYGRRRAQCEEGARWLGVKALRDISPEEFARRESGLPVEVAKRCRFIVEENARVPDMAEALAAGDRPRIRQLCADSFCGAMTLYEIGTPEMQAMMDAILSAPGVIGARQAGAGFGGCLVAFVEEPDTRDFSRAVRRDYFSRTNIKPDLFPVASAAGAGPLDQLRT